MQNEEMLWENGSFIIFEFSKCVNKQPMFPM